MKIEVYKDQDDLTLDKGWKWGIVVAGEIVCETPGVYGRKSDAKRGAERLETKLWEEYMRWDAGDGKLEDGPPIQIEVLD